MNKQWQIRKEADENIVNRIVKKFNISKIVARVIANKGIQDKAAVEVFLNPTRKDFHDPFLMPDMEKAVNRITSAIQKKEKTIIYGDYDVDGITSSVILKMFLEEQGLNTDIYIPNRLDEGYGLNENAIRQIAKEKYTLMITVDCGITGINEVDLANGLGLDVIITDHHEQAESLPNAIAVIDTKRKDNTYPFRGLAGVGVAFKTIQAISQRLGLPEETYLKYLDIVCVGTISDIVPLEDENRVISQLGLKLIKQTKNIGLKVLLESIGYSKIDSTAISFGIAPRINACGRLGNEKIALDLFFCRSEKDAKKITETLNNYNKERQDIEKKIFCEAVELTQKTDLPCIVVGKENWHHGVIGIVASKITEMYGKPSILLCYEGNIARGSGRSIKGFDLHKALEKCSNHIKQFGGHSMAIGITLEKEEEEEFKKELEEYAKNNNIEKIIPIILIDQKVDLSEISVDDVKEFKLLEPFGEANNMPIFQLNNLKIESIRTLSEGKHLKLFLKDDSGKTIDAIGFNLGYLAEEYKIGTKIDVVGSLEINDFKGVETLQISLRDFRHAI